jgi:hypothetical protein
LLLGFVAFPIVPGKALITFTEGSDVPVLLLVVLVAAPLIPTVFFEAELLKGFRVQFGGIGTFLLHPGGLSEDVIAIVLPVLLPEGGTAFVGFAVGLTKPGGTLGIGPVLLPEGGTAFVGGTPVALTEPRRN